MSLWMGNGFKENGPDSDDEKDDSDHDRHEDDRLPLFADGKLPDYISRLEALYGMNTNSYVDHLEGKTPQPFWQEEERLVLEGWIDFVEGPCVDDSCGDEVRLHNNCCL